MRALSFFISVLSAFSAPSVVLPQPTVTGRVLYDAFGGVLTRTLPLTGSGGLTTTLSPVMMDLLIGQGTTDPDTDLVYLGNGRYFDPLLGLPLQPNPIGGAPTVPQSLNRYAATSLGQPGVAEAVVNSGLNPFVRSFVYQMPGATLSFQGIPQLAQALVRPIVRAVPASTGIVEIVGPRASVGFLEAEGFETLSIQPARGWLRSPLSRIFQGLQTQTLRGEMGIAAALADSTFANGESISLGRGVTARLVGQNLSYGVDDVATRAATRRLANTLGVGVAGLLSAGFQYAGDYDNPYLTGGQRLNRAMISGGLGMFASGLGLGSEFLIVGSAGGPVGIIIAIPIAIAFDLILAPTIFNFTGDIPQRKLAPLSQN